MCSSRLRTDHMKYTLAKFFLVFKPPPHNISLCLSPATQDSFKHMEDELHSSQQQYRACLDELEQFERKIQELERELAISKDQNSKCCR